MRKVVKDDIEFMIEKYSDLRTWGYKPWTSREMREYTFLCRHKFFAPCISVSWDHHADQAVWTVWYDNSPWDVIGLAHNEPQENDNVRTKSFNFPEEAVEAMFLDFYVRKSPGIFNGYRSDPLRPYGLADMDKDKQKYGEDWYEEWTGKVGQSVRDCKLDKVSDDTLKQMSEECFLGTDPYEYRDPDNWLQQSDEFLEMTDPDNLSPRKIVVEHVRRMNWPACHVWLWDSRAGWVSKLPDMEETTLILSPEEAAHWIKGGDLPPSNILDYRCVCA